MYVVQIEQTCKCFKKSEYSNTMRFENQKDAYHYAKIVAECMNEEFCGQHIFSAHRVEDSHFVIRVVLNPEAVGIRPHISCDVGCDSTDNWSLESTSKG